jgi:FkbM family methyltransferase
MDDYRGVISTLFEKNMFPEDAFYIDKALGGRKIIVYGAGESFHYFKEVVMRGYGYIPSVVLDRRFRHGDTFEGIPAFSPMDYCPSVDDQENGLVVICLGRQSYFDDVVKHLRQMGFRHIISLLDIYEIHNPFRLPEELESAGFNYYQRQRRRIESCLDLLADDKSREVYVQCLRTHLQRKPVSIPMCDRNEQYTPKGIPISRGYRRYIYCGVSVGELARVLGDIDQSEEVVCFEPDPNQFTQTAGYLAAHHGQTAKRVSAIPCAVYSRDSLEAFTTSDTSFGSRILPSGNTHVQCVMIDHALPGFRPTFISMDIEGAEPEALKGAECTLKSNRPDLAICVYHSPSHLWEIPLYLQELKLGYRFYLRNYSSFVAETVLYAAA